jgi:hypothetical protein
VPDAIVKNLAPLRLCGEIPLCTYANFAEAKLRTFSIPDFAINQDLNWFAMSVAEINNGVWQSYGWTKVVPPDIFSDQPL